MRRWLVIGLLGACMLPSSVFAQNAIATLNVYLDCTECFGDFIREQVDIVEYVRDPAEADVHVIVTVSDTAMDSSSRAITESGDTEDTQRQRLATALTIGLLNYISSDGVRGGLTVDVEQAAPSGQAGPASDRWNHWVFSVQGTVSAQGEESTRELSFGGDVGADRITDDWKITTGFEIEYEREDFDVEDEEEIRATRNERDFDALVARSVNDHWSIGGRTSIDSSSFENISVRTFLAPAVEYNLFPYSQYTRRQLRIGYAIGPYYARYREETLYFTMSDAMAQQEGTVTLDQREQWGRSGPRLNTLRSYQTRRGIACSSTETSTCAWRAGCRSPSRGRPAASAINCRFHDGA